MDSQSTSGWSTGYAQTGNPPSDHREKIAVWQYALGKTYHGTVVYYSYGQGFIRCDHLRGYRGDMNLLYLPSGCKQWNKG